MPPSIRSGRQKKMLGRLPSVSDDLLVGHSAEYKANRDWQLHVLDESEEWVALAVHEYGYDRVMRAQRTHQTEARTLAFLEAERQQNERLRWERGRGIL